MEELDFEEVSKKLKSLLRIVNPETTTTKDIFQLLTDTLGGGVKQHKKRIREAIAKFFEEGEQAEVVENSPEKRDDFSVKLSPILHLRIVQSSVNRCIAIHSRGDKEKDIPSHAIQLSSKDFLKMLEKIEEFTWQEFDEEEQLIIVLESERRIVIEKTEGIMWMKLKDGSSHQTTDDGFALDLAALKKMEECKADILSRLQERIEAARPERDKKRKIQEAESVSSPSGKALKRTIPGNHVYEVELTNRIFLTVSEFRKRMRADLRCYYIDKQSGTLQPTRKGLSMDKQQFMHLIQGVEGLKKAVSEKDVSFFVDIGQNRRAAVSGYSGRCMIDLREYYQPKDSDELKPGKKGISFDVSLLDVLSKEAKDIMNAMD